MVSEKLRIEDVAASFFKEHPCEEIESAYAGEKIKSLYMAKTGKVAGDPCRVVRLLCELKFLEKVRKGVYRYNPKTSSNNTYRCVTGVSENRVKKVADNSVNVQQIMGDCLAKAISKNDINAKQCFQRICDILGEHDITTY